MVIQTEIKYCVKFYGEFSYLVVNEIGVRVGKEMWLVNSHSGIFGMFVYLNVGKVLFSQI